MDKYSIVIADDEAYVMELLAKQLNQEGTLYHVAGKAENGRQALEMVKELKPDILLTDICMPIMDGLELISELQKLQIKVKTVIISGYDDFSYAKQAMSLGVTDYLLKPFSREEMFEVLDKIREDLDHQKILMNNIHQMEVAIEDSKKLYTEQFFRNLLDGKIAPSDISKEAEKAGIRLSANHFAAGIIRVNNPDDDHEKELIRLLDLVKENIFPEDLSVYFMHLSGRQTAALFLGECISDLIFKNRITGGIRSLRESLEKYYDYPLGCVVGGLFSNMEELSLSYRQALSVWKTMLDYEPEAVFYDDVLKRDKKENGPVERPKDLEQKLLRAIQMGQEEKAGEILYEILQYYEGMHVDLGEFVSVALAELVFDISDSLQKAGGANPVWEDAELISYLKDHFECGSLGDAHQALLTYISKCCAQFMAVNEKQGDRIVMQVKELIEENLDDEELSLESVSGMLFFSPNYVRQIFKQISGESFMAYLIRRRMETAGELLLNDNIKIQDVASMTGYSNQRYFASCFKKYYGCTPTEYRRNKDGEDVS